MFSGSRSSPLARPWLGAFLLLWSSWLAVPAHAGDRSAAAPQQTPAALYHNYCSVCHGDNGDGQSRASGSLKPPPRDFTTPQAMQELTRERMLAAVKGGVPGTAMMAWKTQLNDAQIASVVDYVRDTFMRASVAADASRGRQIYARTCSVCHGDRGAGSMWASANLRPAPRDFSAPQARAELTRERMLASVAGGRPGTAMSGYGGKFSAEDIAAVVDRQPGHEAAAAAGPARRCHGGPQVLRRQLRHLPWRQRRRPGPARLLHQSETARLHERRIARAAEPAGHLCRRGGGQARHRDARLGQGALTPGNRRRLRIRVPFFHPARSRCRCGQASLSGSCSRRPCWRWQARRR